VAPKNAFSGFAARWTAVLAFAVPLAVFLIRMRYAGSGHTEPAELLPISLLREGKLDFNEFFSATGDLGHGPVVYPSCNRRP